MKSASFLIIGVAACILSGCDPLSNGNVRNDSPPVVDSRPVASNRRVEQTTRRIERTPELSFDTARDERFGKFVAKTASGMVRKLAVGIDRRGVMRVELDETTAPEDTLPLTKSLMAGARRDFPDKPITLHIYDPEGQPILNALYHPDHGVRYEVAHDEEGPGRRVARTDRRIGNDRSRDDPGVDDTSSSSDHWKSAKAWSGSTASDRKFAEWAYGKGEKYLRYIQVDLERNGRLWFGVTRDVQPDDVSALTRSILQGARTEFPRRALTAKVFDPEGEPIGNATLGSDGQIQWSRVASK